LYSIVMPMPHAAGPLLADQASRNGRRHLCGPKSALRRLGDLPPRPSCPNIAMLRAAQGDQHVDGAVLEDLKAADLAPIGAASSGSRGSARASSHRATASAHSAAIASSMTRSTKRPAPPQARPSTPSARPALPPG